MSRSASVLFKVQAGELIPLGHVPIAADPAAFLASGSLGAAYQSFVGPHTFGAEKMGRWLAELARRLGDAFETASNDFARALIFEATGAGAVPAPVAPFVEEPAGVVAALKRARSAGRDPRRHLTWSEGH